MSRKATLICCIFLLAATLITLANGGTIISKGDDNDDETLKEIEQNFIQVPNSKNLIRFERDLPGEEIGGSGVSTVNENAELDPTTTELAATTTTTKEPEKIKISTTVEKTTEITTLLSSTTTSSVIDTALHSLDKTANQSLGEQDHETQEARARNAEISDHLAFYLGLGAACLVAAWLVLGPIICLIIHARRKWRERQYADVISPAQSNPSGGWFSRWNRGGQSQRLLINANRAPSPPRLGSTNTGTETASAPMPLHEPLPIITISQAYPAQAMTTFSVTNTDEIQQQQQQEPLIQGRSLRTDI